MLTRNSLVRVLSDRVEKYTAAPHEMARKYCAVQRVAEHHGFVAPGVLEVREDHIVLELLSGIRPLKDLYLSSQHTDLEAAVQRAGEVLGHLHRELDGAAAQPWTPSRSFEEDVRRYSPAAPEFAALPQCVLHGDYSFANVFVGASPQVIAVIDPCPNYGSTHEVWTRGPIYLDIGKMLSCLEGQVPARDQFRKPSRSRINELQEIFVRGYGLTAGTASVDAEVAHAFAFATASGQFRRRFGSLGVMRRSALYSRLRGNYPAHRKMASWPKGTP